MTSEKWYSKGLRFSCTECGKCCTGSPGYVWVSEEEIGSMAAFLGISERDFKAKYTRQVGGRVSLIEKRPSYDCVFLKDKKCMVYGARPTQCRTFPWWPQNLRSAEAWSETAATCEGINPEARLVSAEEIENIVTVHEGSAVLKSGAVS